MDKRTGLMVVALVVVLAIGSAESKTIHVKVGGTGDGSSWAAAFGDLQSALNDADPNDEIWVAAGTYYTYVNDPTNTVLLRPGAAVYGGFTGAETQRDERGWYDD